MPLCILGVHQRGKQDQLRFNCTIQDGKKDAQKLIINYSYDQLFLFCLLCKHNLLYVSLNLRFHVQNNASLCFCAPKEQNNLLDYFWQSVQNSYTSIPLVHLQRFALFLCYKEAKQSPLLPLLVRTKQLIINFYDQRSLFCLLMCIAQAPFCIPFGLLMTFDQSTSLVKKHHF